MYLFSDYCGGYRACFTTEQKAKEFVKKYGNAMYQLCGEFPRQGDEYEIQEVNVDIDFDDTDFV